MQGQKVKRAITRDEQIKAIKACFKSQPFGGWRATEQAYYLDSLGIKERKPAEMSNAQILLIYTDLEKANML